MKLVKVLVIYSHRKLKKSCGEIYFEIRLCSEFIKGGEGQTFLAVGIFSRGGGGNN